MKIFPNKTNRIITMVDGAIILQGFKQALNNVNLS